MTAEHPIPSFLQTGPRPEDPPKPSILSKLTEALMPEKPHAAPTPTSPISPSIEQGLQAYYNLVAEAENLRRENGDLRAQVASQRLTVQSAASACSRLQAERDYYMRHSVELTSRLNTILSIINEAIAEAKHGALRPNDNGASRARNLDEPDQPPPQGATSP